MQNKEKRKFLQGEFNFDASLNGRTEEAKASVGTT